MIDENHFKEKANEKVISIIVRKTIEEKTYEIKNSDKISKLKEKIAQTFPINKEEGPLTEDRIRLFFGGKDLKNDEEIQFYNIDNNAVIQLMIRPIFKD